LHKEQLKVLYPLTTPRLFCFSHLQLSIVLWRRMVPGGAPGLQIRPRGGVGCLWWVRFSHASAIFLWSLDITDFSEADYWNLYP